MLVSFLAVSSSFYLLIILNWKQIDCHRSRFSLFELCPQVDERALFASWLPFFFLFSILPQRFDFVVSFFHV